MEASSGHEQQHQEERQMNSGGSGLMRYRSAPSSFFSNKSLFDDDDDDEFLNRASSLETDGILARFLDNSVLDNSNKQQQQYQIKQEHTLMSSSLLNNINTSFEHQQQPGFYQNQGIPSFQDHISGPALDYTRVVKPSGGGVGGNASNLVRHSSSPAGLFSNINIEFQNGYAVLREMGDYGGGGGNNRDRSSYSTTNNNRLSHSSTARMSPIAELGSKNSPDRGGFAEAHGASFVAGYQDELWDDTQTMLSKGLNDDDRTLSGSFSISEMQDSDAGKPPRMLAHHLSLPKTGGEMSAIEHFLQLQDSVPFKVRAKRGCATHPRSIAERVRRTKISERMRKLQDIVPNMDKQTNTADMLDLAVDYIKDLQRQVEMLSENRAHCTCVNNR